MDNKCNENGSIIDDDADDDLNDEEVEDEEEEDDEEEEEETYLQSLVKEVVSLHEDIVNNYVDDPQTPQELSENRSTKKFIVQKVRERLLESFESQQKWTNDEELVAMVKKCKRDLAKNEELEPLSIMKRIIKQQSIIGELVEAAIEEQMEVDEDDDDEGNDQ